MPGLYHLKHEQWADPFQLLIGLELFGVVRVARVRCYFQHHAGRVFKCKVHRTDAGCFGGSSPCKGDASGQRGRAIELDEAVSAVIARPLLPDGVIGNAPLRVSAGKDLSQILGVPQLRPERFR